VRRATSRFVAMQLALVAAVGGALWLSYPAWRLGLITDRLRDEYKDLQFITTADLARWLAPNAGLNPLILDVRTAPEYEVSHLFDARRVEPGAELNPDELPDDHKRAIVVYCTTGERAAEYGRRLERAGYQNVFLLDGALARWANEERPLSNGRELVTRIHPGDSKSARLIKNAHRAAVPVTP
jgi:rhodanese-related sulfurtransferase